MEIYYEVHLLNETAQNNFKERRDKQEVKKVVKDILQSDPNANLDIGVYINDGYAGSVQVRNGREIGIGA